MKRTLRWAIIGLAALLCLPAAAMAAAPLQKVKVLLAVKTVDEAFSPYTVAKYMGYFAQEGLDVDLLPVGGSNEVAIEVSAGNADVGAASPGEALVGIEAGKLDIRYFYDCYYRNIWSISVPTDSPIKTLADLKGKKLGVQSMGSAGVTFARAFVQSAGLDPDKDVSFVAIGVGAQAINALRQHAVDGIVFWDEALVKMSFAGLKVRPLPVPEALAGLPDTSMLARTETLTKDPKMLIGIARAVAKGYDFTMANPQAAVEITWKLFPEAKPGNMSEAQALKAGVTVNQGRMAIWETPQTKEKHGLFIDSQWKNLVDFLVKEKIMKAPLPSDRIYTNALIDKSNDYDRAAVIAQAKHFDMSKLK